MIGGHKQVTRYSTADGQFVLKLKTYLRMHEDNGQLANQFSGKGSQKEADFYYVRHDNTECIAVIRIGHTVAIWAYQKSKFIRRQLEALEAKLSYSVVEAKSVSSFRRRPSRATPRRSEAAEPRRGVICTVRR